MTKKIIINDLILDRIAMIDAVDILDQTNNFHEACDLAHKYADESEWAKNTHKARTLCENCNKSDGLAFVADCFADTPMNCDETAKRIARGEIYGRIVDAIYSLMKESIK